MSFFKDKPVVNRSTSHIYRPHGGVGDVREVIDRAAQVSVLAFPMKLVPSLVASELACPACYVLAGGTSIYVGETNNAGRRLPEHAADPQKKFAQQVFVVRGAAGFRFTKETTACYLQYGLTRAAEECGVMTVVAGSPPRQPDIDPLEIPLHERILDDSRRLLFDAGLVAFEPALGGGWNALLPTNAAPEAIDADESGPMEIDVHLPRAGTEYEMLYDDTIWAHGYHAGDRFVVGAGSDIRIVTNPSSSSINRPRRAALFDAGVLSPIPGAADRMRLMVDVAFTSMAIAAKVTSGAHVDSSKWRPIDPNQRPLMQL